MPTSAWPQKCLYLVEEPLTDMENPLSEGRITQERRQVKNQLQTLSLLQTMNNYISELMSTCNLRQKYISQSAANEITKQVLSYIPSLPFTKNIRNLL